MHYLTYETKTLSLYYELLFKQIIKVLSIDLMPFYLV